ncbi:MAG: hypothetical protein AB7V48_05270 [Sedimentibacter sp.]
MKEHVDLDKLAAHIHDTRGLGIANTYAAYQEGIYRFDSALGGLGGCRLYQVQQVTYLLKM